MKPIRLRASVLGILVGAVVCALTPYNNQYLGATPLGGGNFPLAAFVLFVWLAVFFAVLGRIMRYKAFSGPELLVAWALSALMSGIAATGLARTLFINLSMPLLQAGQGRMGQAVLPLLPARLFPTDAEAVNLLQEGLSGGYGLSWAEVLRQIPWDAWSGPLTWWLCFIAAVYAAFLGLTGLLSRQWIQNERMNLPLFRLPEIMSLAYDRGALGSFLANPHLLAGVGVPLAMHLLNGAAFYYPSIPAMPTVLLAGPYFPKTGWLAGFAKLKLQFYPAFIGFAFLAARQVSLSCWVFYLLGCLGLGLAQTMGLASSQAALGVVFGPALTDPVEIQVIGATVVFFLFILWLGREQMTGAVRALAFILRGRRRDPDDLPKGTAGYAALFAAGFGLVCLWLTFFGLSWPMALASAAVFFAFVLVAARVVSQGGLAYFTLTAAPLDTLLTALGSKVFAPVGLLLAACAQKVLFVDLREALLPALLNTAKSVEEVQSRRVLKWGVAAALAVAVVVSLTATLAVSYRFGLRDLKVEWETSTVATMYENVARLVESPQDPNPALLGYCAFGGLVMAGLVLCYQRFTWWPLHPLGYLVLYSSSMRLLWFSFFLGWLANMLTLRYGGVGLFAKVRLFFIGLILGDFMMSAAYALMGLSTGQCYLVLPN